MAKYSEHAEAMELIGYGLSKFAGMEKGKNNFANAMAKNRSAFFQELVDLGIATSTKAVSVRQDNYDPFFENAKNGFVRPDIVKRYEVIKPRIDAVVGSLSFDEYVDFTKELIKFETGKKVSKKYVALIEIAKNSVYGKASVESEDDENDEVDTLDSVQESDSENEDSEDVKLHTKIQWILIQIGKSTGCDVFVATNDRSKTYQGHTLGEYCIDELPARGLDETTYKTIQLIDVVWVKENRIVSAFEIECTTSIYSGILRISDMAYSNPYNTIKGYIVAPEVRKKKVIKELSRPTFCNNHIQGFIQYMTAEELNELYENLGAIKMPPGAIGIEIVDGIAKSV